MKKIVIQALALLMCFALTLFATGCRNGENNETTGSPETSLTQTTENATELSTEGAASRESALVPESDKVSADYFDNAAFVGDSVSLKLSYYAAATGALGNAQFFTAGSLGSGNALWEVSDESVHPSYQGVKMLVEDCVAYSGADVVYIMLGMNDIALYGIDDSVANYKTLVDNIKAQSPDIKVVIQSMTPMTDTSTIFSEDLNNDVIKEYNNRLLALCNENHWDFVDVASVMYDAEGINLNRDFCSDPDGLGVHFTEAGCEAWVEYLSTHTP